jgi:hypothetical protein
VSVTATEARRRHQAERRTRRPAGEPRPRTGPADTLSAAEAFALVCELPVVAGTPSSRRNQRLWGIPLILAWLEQHPGEGWQERWLAASADQGTGWLDDIVAGDPRKPHFLTI